MSGAGSRLQQRRIHIREVLDLENPARRVGAVFSEAAVHGHTVGLEVFAEQLITTTAVEALVAQLGVVSDDSIANVKVLDLGADGSDDADGFVTGDERELLRLVWDVCDPQ